MQCERYSCHQFELWFISNFEFYLKSRVRAHNTAMKYLGGFKKIVLNCVRRNWLPRDPFFGYKLSKPEVERDFLMDDELKRIVEKQFGTERLALVRDIFVFSYYTGVSVCNVKKLRHSEINTGLMEKNGCL